MMKGLAPHTSQLFDAITRLECIKPFVLVGGTALSLQLGTRQSEDLDFMRWKLQSAPPRLRRHPHRHSGVYQGETAGIEARGLTSCPLQSSPAANVSYNSSEISIIREIRFNSLLKEKCGKVEIVTLWMQNEY